MRIRDISPGYLNSEQLLEEHRVLHEIVASLTSGSSSTVHGEDIIRWKGFGWALKQRHLLLVEELRLRGFADITPVRTRSNKGHWPKFDSEEPMIQLQALDEGDMEVSPGRIPLPVNAQQFWAQHKYSILARDQNFYKRTGKQVAGMRRNEDFTTVVFRVTRQLQKRPSAGGLQNAIQHMWGHVSDKGASVGSKCLQWSAHRLLREIQHRAVEYHEHYLLDSTALGELPAWLD